MSASPSDFHLFHPSLVMLSFQPFSSDILVEIDHDQVKSGDDPKTSIEMFKITSDGFTEQNH